MAENRPGLEDPAGRTAPELPAHQGPSAEPIGPADAIAARAAAPSGPAPRQERRSQRFAYATQSLQAENLTYAILTQPSQGWVTNNGDGTFSFDPGLDFRDLKAGETRRISFSYQVSDGWSGTETSSATLTVTGSADGTLTIEAAAGNASRRAAQARSTPPDAGTVSADPPAEAASARPAETSAEAKRPGAAYDLNGDSGVVRGSGGTTPPNAGPADPFLAGGAPGEERPETDGPGPGSAAAFPAAAAVGSDPEEAVEPAVAEPGFGIRPPLTHDAAAGPPMDDALPPDSEEAPAAPDPGPGLRGAPDDAVIEPRLPTEPLLQPADEFPHAAPRGPAFEPGSLAPEPMAGGKRWRYTILAQPSEGRVKAVEDGGFDFTPGPDFPALAIGELEQVSFTCEATDAEGARSIVIATLTVTGTADGPEIGDVTYRQAQGQNAAGRAVPEAGVDEFDIASHDGEADPGAAVDDWPLATPPDPAEGGAAEPNHGSPAVATGLDDDRRSDPPGGELAVETPDPDAASLPGQPDTGIGAKAFDPIPGSAAEPSPDAGAETSAAGVLAGSRHVDPAARDRGAEMQSEAPPSPIWQASPVGAPNAADEDPAPVVEPPVEEHAVPGGGDTYASGDRYGDRQAEPAAWESFPEAPAEAASPPSWHDAAGAEWISGVHQDSEAAAGHPADGAVPLDDGDAPAMPDVYGERPTTGITGEDEQPGSSYRGAVAAEAVTTFLAGDSDVASAGDPDAHGIAGAAPEEPPSWPEAADEVTPAGIGPDRRAESLDDLFGAAEPGGLRPSDDREASGGASATPADPAPDELPIAGPDAATDDGTAPQMPDSFAETAAPPVTSGDDAVAESDIGADTAEEDMDEPTELSDFSLSQDAVVEKSEVGTAIGQILVAGADQGSRFIFDLQNDAGGRFDINPRTGKITVADGSLLDHAAAQSHDIMVQVIAHSGVSCRKTLTINVLPSDAGQAVTAPPSPAEANGSPAPGGLDVARAPAPPADHGRGADAARAGQNGQLAEEVTVGGTVDTLHLDGVAGGPGLGGWTLELTAGEVVETNDDHLMLSENATGIVILDGSPVNVAFEGVERIEW